MYHRDAGVEAPLKLRFVFATLHIDDSYPCLITCSISRPIKSVSHVKSHPFSSSRSPFRFAHPSISFVARDSTRHLNRNHRRARYRREAKNVVNDQFLSPPSTMHELRIRHQALHLTMILGAYVLLSLATASPVGPPRSKSPPFHFDLSSFIRQTFDVSFPTYTLSATPIPLNDPPAGSRQQILSIFALNTNFSDVTSIAVIGCLAVNTATDSSAWGLFNASVVTADLIQAQYFANVPVKEVTLNFRQSASSFIADPAGLTSCVRETTESDLATKGSLFAGRSTGDREAVAFKGNDASIKSWAGAVVVAAFAGIALLIIFVLVAAVSVKKYSPSDYSSADSYRDPPPVSPRSASLNEQLSQLAGCEE
jgi:hypothetical protein